MFPLKSWKELQYFTSAASVNMRNSHLNNWDEGFLPSISARWMQVISIWKPSVFLDILLLSYTGSSAEHLMLWLTEAFKSSVGFTTTDILSYSLKRHVRVTRLLSFIVFLCCRKLAPRDSEPQVLLKAPALVPRASNFLGKNKLHLEALIINRLLPTNILKPIFVGKKKKKWQFKVKLLCFCWTNTQVDAKPSLLQILFSYRFYVLKNNYLGWLL